jgi:Sec-independent protein translocase protein TatA
MASTKRTNLISLLGLLLLVAIVAITPEARQMAGRLADWIEGVKQERAEIRQRQEEQQAREQAQAEETPPAEAEATPAAPPLHTVRDEDGLYQPEPGYWWIDNDPANLAVEWRPGTLHPDDPRVVASSQPDQWSPAPGYDWIEEKGVDDLRVAWKPGKAHAIFGHVLAAAKEGEWTPAPGWAWANDDPNDLTVVPANGGS